MQNKWEMAFQLQTNLYVPGKNILSRQKDEAYVDIVTD